LGSSAHESVIRGWFSER